MPRTDVGTIFIEDMEVGMSRSLSKQMGHREVELFAEVSEDFNPLHLDDAYAAETMFEERIAHGMLSAALFSALLGERLPGHGTVYLGQNLKFLAPVKIGDTVDATVTVAEIDTRRRRVRLDCEAKVGDTVVIRGEANVLAPSRD